MPKQSILKSISEGMSVKLLSKIIMSEKKNSKLPINIIKLIRFLCLIRLLRAFPSIKEIIIATISMVTLHINGLNATIKKIEVIRVNQTTDTTICLL